MPKTGNRVSTIFTTFILTVSITLLAVGLSSCAVSGSTARKHNNVVSEKEFSYIGSVRKAAERGDAYAQYNLGLLYSSGQDVPQSDSKAAHWYHQAAAQGFADAQFALGVMYYYGRGVTKDYSKAVRWFRRAVDQGSIPARYNLGNMYFRGQGIPQNYAKAAYWFRQAADQGVARAQYGLGLLYSGGLGVPKNLTAAIKWLILAKASGSGDAPKVLADLESRTSHARIVAAQKEAQEWWQTHRTSN